MDYEAWITRERRIRVSLLRDGSSVRGERVFRVCRKCDEICLCHESVCPNCGSKRIVEKVWPGDGPPVEERIRCRSRFKSMERWERR